MSWLDSLSDVLEKGSDIYDKHRGRGVNDGVQSSYPETAQEPVDDHLTSGDDNFYNSQNGLLLGAAVLLILVLLLMRRR